MSKAKFTKGPWVAKKGTGWFVSRPNARMAHVVGMRPELSFVGAENDDEAEARANAHLIAAAPELYEALQACLDHGSMTGHDFVIEQAHAALAKARGEA